MGKLIVIEGLDGSGKSTQLELLPKKLKARGTDCRTVSFPQYESDSSALVKMYLRGDFGTHPDDVNPYAASAFYRWTGMPHINLFGEIITTRAERWLRGGTPHLMPFIKHRN